MSVWLAVPVAVLLIGGVLGAVACVEYVSDLLARTNSQPYRFMRGWRR